MPTRQVHRQGAIASFNVGNAVNRTSTGVSVDFGSVFDIFEYSAEIDFTMQAGTNYWISIYANTVGENDDFCWQE